MRFVQIFKSLYLCSVDFYRKEETLSFFEDVFIITHISESGKFQTYELIISKRVSRTSYIYIFVIYPYGAWDCYLLYRRWALPEPRNMDIIVTVPTFFYFRTRLLWGIDGHITLISVMKSISRTTNVWTRNHSFPSYTLFSVSTEIHTKSPPSDEIFSNNYI
ncbi:hypothetical protein HMPREF9447_00157 [Bacteroides oleiciplenus YIT 12058]|uniref:Uncharacterized protein n=1 Tax=Bacteroides oleiciplenus YIT 12058 TaxID=742727 RepID=K9ETI6_9BACE|nr:hypothetical protein HMPREF9447_00157 [Bacteroides oleiciplenus YIT 12058]